MKIALYMRLSRADGPDAESNSITNQRLMLKEYAQKNFPGRVCEEFVDDGYSGGNFDRPAFKRMIGDCRKGIVDTIIVKDLSRFGRNNVDVSDYVEQIFPLLGVQLVSILDKYDAAKSKDGLMDMATSMMNVVNTYVLFDLSKKVRAARVADMKEGKPLSKTAPFGYECDDRSEGWKINKKQARTVRRIFDLALEGKKTGEIAKILNRSGVPTRMQTTGKGRSETFEEFVQWESKMVKDILENETYTGVLIQGKTRVLVPGKNYIRKTDSSEQFRHENHHPAIVSKEKWEQIQNSFQKAPPRKKHYGKDGGWILKGKVRCGICNRKLRGVVAGKVLCRREGCETSMLEEDLNEAVLASIARKRNQAEEAIKAMPDIDDSVEQEQIEQLTEYQADIYEAFMDGEITEETYEEMRDASWQELEKLKQVVKEKGNERFRNEEQKRRLQWFLNKSQGKLTTQMADDIIDKVVVKDENVTVYFKEP